LLWLHSCPDGHAAHAAPPAPHEVVVSDPYGTHVLPLQQPFGHEFASQTHCPPLLHVWPCAHAVQATPPAPHDCEFSFASGSHRPALQHPAHELPLHEHCPFVHTSPELHAPQAAPARPHWACDCEEYGTHVFPWQQPFGHEVASQTHCPVLTLHSWPVSQAWQLDPGTPHDSLDSFASGSHVVPLQHPVQPASPHAPPSGTTTSVAESMSPGQLPASHVE
jgi:hypothetical protein